MKFSAKNHLKIIIVVAVGFTIMFAGSKVAFGTPNPFYIVSSGSMMPTIKVYDVIMVQGNVPFDHIKVGDIIAFKNPSVQGELIVHRVAQILSQNPLAVRTKGDANQDSIPGTDLPITKADYIGKVTYVIPQIGYLMRILTPINYVIMFAIVGTCGMGITAAGIGSMIIIRLFLKRRLRS